MNFTHASRDPVLTGAQVLLPTMILFGELDDRQSLDSTMHRAVFVALSGCHGNSARHLGAQWRARVVRARELWHLAFMNAFPCMRVVLGRSRCAGNARQRLVSKV